MAVHTSCYIPKYVILSKFEFPAQNPTPLIQILRNHNTKTLFLSQIFIGHQAPISTSTALGGNPLSQNGSTSSKFEFPAQSPTQLILILRITTL